MENARTMRSWPKGPITSASYHLLSAVEAKNAVLKLHRVWGHQAHRAEKTQYH